MNVPVERGREHWIRRQAESLAGRVLDGRLLVREDTTDFMAIERDQILLLDQRYYLVGSNERERRFGLEDEPKFWVKRGVDLMTGDALVIKLVFRESFVVRVGDLVVRCARSPEKEGRVLDLVRGDDRFMQGHAVPDARGNLVRIIRLLDGIDLLTHLRTMTVSHETYFHTLFPGFLARSAEQCHP